MKCYKQQKSLGVLDRDRSADHLVDIVGCMLLNVAHPVPDVVEGGLVRHIINQEDAHGSSVVCCA